MSEPIQCLEAMIWPNDDGTYDCPWIGDRSVRRGCEWCYMILEWKIRLECEELTEGRFIAHGKHPDWPGEWVCIIEILDRDGRLAGYEAQMELYKSLHDIEAAGWTLIYGNDYLGKGIYASEEWDLNHPKGRNRTMIQNISIDNLHPHPRNPRKALGDLTELAESIKAKGIFQNLTVVWDNAISEKLGSDHYTVVIGHRRMAAAKLAGLTELPCAIVDMNERDQIATMLLENIQRADLTIMEQAEGFQMMIDLGETVKGISSKTGFSETTVKHRIKLNDLDKQKLQEASMRGGRIEDYIALEKIKDPKAKAQLLDSVGTNNFKWALDRAIEEQEKPERKKALVCELNKFAKPIKASDKLEYVTSWYEFKGKVEKPKNAKTTEYFYTIDNCRATLYKKPSAKSEPKKTKQQISFEERKAQLELLAKKAFQSRRDFVEGFASTKKHAAEILAFAFSRWINGGSMNTDKALKMLGVKSLKNIDWKQKRELMMEKYREDPERTMLCLAYCYGDDGEYSDYHSAESWNGWRIVYSKNDKLDNLYDALVSLGYELSDEEQQLRDGTHELFDKPRSKDAPATAAPEDEEEQEDDDAE